MIVCFRIARRERSFLRKLAVTWMPAKSDGCFIGYLGKLASAEHRRVAGHAFTIFVIGLQWKSYCAGTKRGKTSSSAYPSYRPISAIVIPLTPIGISAALRS